jgi:HSP20 family protein
MTMPVRWQPFEWRTEMNRLQDELNRLFGRFDLGDSPASVTRGTYPALNVWEDHDCLYVEAELPGLELADLEIYVHGGNQLTIKGERKQSSAKKGTWHRQERGFGRFGRLFELPSDVDADKVEASFKHGVLTIKLPKHEAARPRRIDVVAE